MKTSFIIYAANAHAMSNKTVIRTQRISTVEHRLTVYY